MEISVEYVNRIKKDEHDIELHDRYLKSIRSLDNTFICFPEKLKITQNMTDELIAAFPVKEEIMSNSPLTRIGFLMLAIDNEYMERFYVPNCNALINRELPQDFFSVENLKLLRASLIEFAMMGCMQAQILMTKLNEQFGTDECFIEDIVNERCINLKRFINAHEGEGVGVNTGDAVSSYQIALNEVKSGKKSSHWIWYICPQMKGIKGTHSRPALYYGINGRLEAFQYINHLMLRRHLIEIADAILASKYNVYEIFGVDVIKVRSCIQLFASVSDIPQLKKIINKYNWN